MYEQLLADTPENAPWMLGFTLGKLLPETDLARARPLVEAARASASKYDKEPLVADELAEIDAWLAEHPAAK